MGVPALFPTLNHYRGIFKFALSYMIYMYIYILRSKWLSLVTLKCVALHAIFLKGQSMNFSFAELSLAKEIDLDLWTFDNSL